jgi:hypothetical protein
MLATWVASVKEKLSSSKSGLLGLKVPNREICLARFQQLFDEGQAVRDVAPVREGLAEELHAFKGLPLQLPAVKKLVHGL